MAGDSVSVTAVLFVIEIDDSVLAAVETAAKNGKIVQFNNLILQNVGNLMKVKFFNSKQWNNWDNWCWLQELLEEIICQGFLFSDLVIFIKLILQYYLITIIHEWNLNPSLFSGVICVDYTNLDLDNSHIFMLKSYYDNYKNTNTE